jgi:hypothetical protein
MGGDDGHDDVRRLWRDQPSEEIRMSAQEVRGLAEKFERIIRRRNRREYGAAAFAVVWYCVWAWIAGNAVVSVGCWLVALAALFVVFHLHRHGAARRPPGEQEGMSGLEFYRSELVRQRDLVRSVWRWYLLPFVPGMLLILVGYWLERPGGWHLLPFGIFVAVTFAGIGLLNQRVARKLQRRLDDLDALRQA